MKTLLSLVIPLCTTVALVSCGGGSSGNGSSLSLSGTAATGSPIGGGQIVAKCADGSSFVNSVTSDNLGRWSGTLTNASALPCALQISYGTPTQTLHSFASSLGTVNISPLTDLSLALATGEDPSAWFDAYNGTSPTSSTLEASASDVGNSLRAQGFLLPSTGSAFTTPFEANHTSWDMALDQLQSAIEQSLSITYKDLIDSLKNGDTDALATLPSPPPNYPLNGVIDGAADTISWQLLINGKAYTSGLNKNGPFTISPSDGIPNGSQYQFNFKNPQGQTCSASNAVGTMSADNSDIIIQCTSGGKDPGTNTFTLTGTLTGSNANGNVTWNTKINNVPPRSGVAGSDGLIFFDSGLVVGDHWTITITRSPTGQNCSVSPDQGIIQANVDYIVITCADINTPTYSISGSISGAKGNVDWNLASNGTIINTGSHNAGNVNFSAAIALGSAYELSIINQPSGQTCTINNATGTISNNVNDVEIVCSDLSTARTINGNISGATGNLSWELLLNGISTKTGEASNGAITFIDNADPNDYYFIKVTVAPTGHWCEVFNAVGQLTKTNTEVPIICHDSSIEPEPINLHDFSKLTLRPTLPTQMPQQAPIPTLTALNPGDVMQDLYESFIAEENARIFTAPSALNTYGGGQSGDIAYLYETASDSPYSWRRESTLTAGPDNIFNTGDDIIERYEVLPYGRTHSIFTPYNQKTLPFAWYAFNSEGADGQWFTHDDTTHFSQDKYSSILNLQAPIRKTGVNAAIKVTEIKTLSESGYAHNDPAGIEPTLVDVSGLSYELILLDDQGKEYQVVRYKNAGPDGKWFTADDTPDFYSLIHYEDGNAVASYRYNAGNNGIWFDADDSLIGYTATLFDNERPQYTAIYTSNGANSTWFDSDDMISSWIYYGYDGNGHLLLTATHKTKGSDGQWFTNDDGVSAEITPFVEKGRAVINAKFNGFGADGLWLSGDESLDAGYTFIQYDENDRPIRYAHFSNKGSDGKWFTADDQAGSNWERVYDTDGKLLNELSFKGSPTAGNTLFSQTNIASYSQYDHQNKLRNFYNNPGADGIWFTADDQPSSSEPLIYNDFIPSNALANNTGFALPTCDDLAGGSTSGVIKVKVVDQNNNPLENATVMLDQNGSMLNTDSNGEALFDHLTGKYEVHFFKDGYSWESFYCVAPSANTVLRAQLLSQSEQPTQSEVKLNLPNMNGKSITARLLDENGKVLNVLPADDTFLPNYGPKVSLLFNLPSGTEVTGTLWLLESGTRSLSNAISLPPQTFTTGNEVTLYSAFPYPAAANTIARTTKVIAQPSYLELGDGFTPLQFYTYPTTELVYSTHVSVSEFDLPTTKLSSLFYGSTVSTWTARQLVDYPDLTVSSTVIDVADFNKRIQRVSFVNSQSDKSSTPRIHWLPTRIQNNNANYASVATIKIMRISGEKAVGVIHVPAGESSVQLPVSPISTATLPDTMYYLSVETWLYPEIPDYFELLGSYDLNHMPRISYERARTVRSQGFKPYPKLNR